MTTYDVINWKALPPEEARKHFETFRKSNLELGQFCRKNSFSQPAFARLMRTLYPDEWEMVRVKKKRKTSAYVLGRSLEYSVRDLLLRHGYYVVRAAQSKGKVDLVGLRSDGAVLVQCKRSGLISQQESGEVHDIALRVGATPVVASRPTGRGVKLHLLQRTDKGVGRSEWAFPALPAPESAFQIGIAPSASVAESPASALPTP